MDAILQFLNESRQTTVFPIIVWVSSCVTCCGAFAVGVVLASDRRGVLLEAVKEAMRMADVALTSAAIDMDVSKGVLSRKLSGEKPLSLDALSCLPDEFFQWFAVALAQRVGVPQTVQVGARLARRQARMSLTQQQKVGVA